MEVGPVEGGVSKGAEEVRGKHNFLSSEAEFPGDLGQGSDGGVVPAHGVGVPETVVGGREPRAPSEGCEAGGAAVRAPAGSAVSR